MEQLYVVKFQLFSTLRMIRLIGKRRIILLFKRNLLLREAHGVINFMFKRTPILPP